jgi:hypothetical protein
MHSKSTYPYDTAISKYSTDHTGANTHDGGANGGFLREAYFEGVVEGIHIRYHLMYVKIPIIFMTGIRSPLEKARNF